MTAAGEFEKSMRSLGMFWWAFAVRGGAAILFSAYLLYAGGFFGIVFFDPILFVFLSTMLGFYVLGNGILLGVAAAFAGEHRMRIWKLLLCESIFAAALGFYIAISLLLSPKSLAWLSGLHAAGTGCFLLGLAIRVRTSKPYAWMLASAGVIAVGVGIWFLLHSNAPPRIAMRWLGGFELFYGVVIAAFALGFHRGLEPVILAPHNDNVVSSELVVS